MNKVLIALLCAALTFGIIGDKDTFRAYSAKPGGFVVKRQEDSHIFTAMVEEDPLEGETDVTLETDSTGTKIKYKGLLGY